MNPLFSLLILLAPALPAADAPAARKNPDKAVRLLVPAYFYPSGVGERDWRRMIEDSNRAPITAIVNPASGPGDSRNADYDRILRAAKKSKLQLIGYVDLGYAKRPIEAVRADCDRWRRLYPEAVGFFFDQQPSDAASAKFVGECVEYARKLIPGCPVVCNPGVPCAEDYAKHETSLCLFEHEKGFAKWALPAWAERLPASRISVLIYGVEKNRWKRLFSEAREKGAGLLLITDAKGPMPWNRLPSYWKEEVEAAAAARLKK